MPNFFINDNTFIINVLFAFLIINIVLSLSLLYKENKIIEIISWFIAITLFLATSYQFIINLLESKNPILSITQSLLAIVLNLLSVFLLFQYKSKFTHYAKTFYFAKTAVLLTTFNTSTLLILYSFGFFAGVVFEFLLTIIDWIITGFLSYFYLKKIKQQGNFLSALINSFFLILCGYIATYLLLLPINIIIVKNLTYGMSSNMLYQTNIIDILIYLTAYLLILALPPALASFIYTIQNKNNTTLASQVQQDKISP